MSITQLTTINAMQARQQFGELINRALYGGEVFIVERAGKPVLRIEALSDEQSRQRQQAKTRFMELSQQVATGFADLSEAHRRHIIDEAIQEVRREQ